MSFSFLSSWIFLIVSKRVPLSMISSSLLEPVELLLGAASAPFSLPYPEYMISIINSFSFLFNE
jgi:hypothetical protein